MNRELCKDFGSDRRYDRASAVRVAERWHTRARAREREKEKDKKSQRDHVQSRHSDNRRRSGRRDTMHQRGLLRLGVLLKRVRLLTLQKKYLVLTPSSLSPEKIGVVPKRLSLSPYLCNRSEYSSFGIIAAFHRILWVALSPAVR